MYQHLWGGRSLAQICLKEFIANHFWSAAGEQEDLICGRVSSLPGVTVPQARRSPGRQLSASQRRYAPSRGNFLAIRWRLTWAEETLGSLAGGGGQAER